MIYYTKGSAVYPKTEGDKIICHICNDAGLWGAGFVVALSKRWPGLQNAYSFWHSTKTTFRLGAVQFVDVENDIQVANMIGQHGVRSLMNPTPIRYNAVEECLKTVITNCYENNKTLHMPRIGCGLAGGNWEHIERIINKILTEVGDVDIYVYDLN